jgi:hypothetical protein
LTKPSSGYILGDLSKPIWSPCSKLNKSFLTAFLESKSGQVKKKKVLEFVIDFFCPNHFPNHLFFLHKSFRDFAQKSLNPLHVLQFNQVLLCFILYRYTQQFQRQQGEKIPQSGHPAQVPIGILGCSSRPMYIKQNATSGCFLSP